MAWLLKLKEAGEAAGIPMPVQEETRIQNRRNSTAQAGKKFYNHAESVFLRGRIII